MVLMQRSVHSSFRCALLRRVCAMSPSAVAVCSACYVVTSRAAGGCYVVIAVSSNAPCSVSIQEFDVNKDGFVSPKEFRRAMEMQKVYSE